MISDSNGKLLLYTNNCALYNGNHNIIPRSDSLNPGTVTYDYCYSVLGAYPSRSSTIILHEFDENSLSIFHFGQLENTDPGLIYKTRIARKTTLFFNLLKKYFDRFI